MGTFSAKRESTAAGRHDTYGNNNKVSISSGGVTLSSTATYTPNGNLLSSTTDALGNVTNYSYDTDTGVLEWVQLPEDSDSIAQGTVLCVDFCVAQGTVLCVDFCVL